MLDQYYVETLKSCYWCDNILPYIRDYVIAVIVHNASR